MGLYFIFATSNLCRNPLSAIHPISWNRGIPVSKPVSLLNFWAPRHRAMSCGCFHALRMKPMWINVHVGWWCYCRQELLTSKNRKLCTDQSTYRPKVLPNGYAESQVLFLALGAHSLSPSVWQFFWQFATHFQAKHVILMKVYRAWWTQIFSSFKSWK